MLGWTFAGTEGFKNNAFNIFFITCLLPYLAILAATITYQFVKNAFRAGKLLDRNEEYKREGRKDFVDAPINPFFIKASLNSIISAPQLNPDKIRDSLIKLSSLSDYIFHQPPNGKALLDNEIEQLENYIELLQKESKNKITVSVHPDIMKGKYEIKPLQLISFLENIFLRDTDETEELQIDIALNSKKNMLKVLIRNISSNKPEKQLDEYVQSNPINIKRKLIINCFQKEY